MHGIRHSFGLRGTAFTASFFFAFVHQAFNICVDSFAAIRMLSAKVARENETGANQLHYSPFDFLLDVFAMNPNPKRFFFRTANGLGWLYLISATIILPIRLRPLVYAKCVVSTVEWKRMPAC